MGSDVRYRWLPLSSPRHPPADSNWWQLTATDVWICSGSNDVSGLGNISDFNNSSNVRRILSLQLIYPLSKRLPPELGCSSMAAVAHQHYDILQFLFACSHLMLYVCVYSLSSSFFFFFLSFLYYNFPHWPTFNVFKQSSTISDRRSYLSHIIFFRSKANGRRCCCWQWWTLVWAHK